MSDQLQNYFGDGSQLGVRIRYVHEQKRMGTAGALRMAEISADKPVIVMNGDILTNLDFKHFLQFHKDGGHSATMAVRMMESRIPYGVVEISDTQVVAMQEKPVRPYLINAGIYCFNAESLQAIPYDEYYDMNQLINSLLEKKCRVGAFPINEYWIDIGQAEDYEKANLEYSYHFEKK